MIRKSLLVILFFNYQLNGTIVQLTKYDVRRLQPGIYYNDGLMSFKLALLHQSFTTDQKKQIHIFDNSLFNTLEQINDTFGIASAFLKASSMTSPKRLSKEQINIFEKDFIFLPVNTELSHRYHWSLVVIIRPYLIVDVEAKLRKKDISVDNNINLPCILHIDSTGNYHDTTNIFKLLLTYLWFEREAQRGLERESIIVDKDRFTLMAKSIKRIKCKVSFLVYGSYYLLSTDHFHLYYL